MDPGRVPEDLRLRIDPHLADAFVCALTVGQVEDWLADLHDTGLSWNTCRNAKVTLASMLSFAARRDEDGVTLPHVAQCAQLPGEEPVGDTRIPEPEQVAAVLTTLLLTNPELATFERIAAVTGARRGEIGALRIDDVFDDGLRFDEAVRMESIDGSAVLDIGNTKGRQQRFVETDPLTISLVRAWVVQRRIIEPRALMFADANGGPQHPERWSHRWRRACALHGLSTHQHALRHLVGTLTA